MAIEARMSLSIAPDRWRDISVVRIIDPTEADLIFVLNKYRLSKKELLIEIAPPEPYNRRHWVDFDTVNGTSYLMLLGNRGYYRLSAAGRSDQDDYRILVDPHFRPIPTGDDPDDYLLGGQDDRPNVTDFELVMRACVEFLQTGDLSHDLTEISPILAWIDTW